MGEMNWNNFLRELYQNYVGKILTFNNFKTNLVKYDRGRNLILKFNKMMMNKGIVDN